MKIISKYKDFYDRNIEYGLDENILYIRDQTIIEDPKLDIVYSKGHFSKKKGLALNDLVPTTIYTSGRYYKSYESLYILGFCGEIILIQSPFEYYNLNLKHKEYIKKYTIFDNELIETSLKIKIDNFNDLDIEFENINNLYERNRKINQINAFKNSKELKDLFFTYKVPIFLIYSENYKFKLQLNPNLEVFNFAKCKNYSQTYQQIEMFLGNQLVQYNAPKIPVGDTKVIIESHGFDYKTSFRKEKEIKK